ncbi:MAG TPA: ATP-binding protein [Chthonomonadaceae bacterium]|nr:ATP-binding protein [Chthonomonadaceae bacterium]
MPLNSIRSRMTLAFACSTALLMFLACGVLTWYAWHAAEQNARTLLLAATQKIYDDLTDDEHQVPVFALVGEEEEMLGPNNMALLVVDARGHVIAQSRRDIPAWPHPRQDDWRLQTLPFGSYTIVIGLPWRATGQALYHQAILLFLLSLVVTIAAALGAWLLVGRTLSPITALSRQAQTASAENLHLRLNAPSEDAEIAELVSTLNGLLRRIADTVAVKERFHAAASHELRTPLQVLSGHLELALNRERSNEEYRRFIEEANTHSQRLVALTRDLLLLHQLDSAQPTLKTEVHLADICERVLRSLTPLIRERALHMHTELPEDAIIEAAPTHAEMLVRNLMENAVKYATPGGHIRICLWTCPDRMELTIYNECAPLASRDLDRLFEPFYRPDAARNSDTGGTGLGLAICKAIAEANGWKLTLRQAQGGIEASVVLSVPSEQTQTQSETRY